MKKSKNKFGSVLIITLWVMAIMAIFTVGIGFRSAINLRLARQQQDRLSAYLLARAGIYKAIDVLDKDNNNYDSLNEPWSTGYSEEKIPLLKDMSINEGSSDIFNVAIIDEGSKININIGEATSGFTKYALMKLFESTDTNNPEGLVEVIAKWVDNDLNDNDLGKDFFKNSKLRIPEELLIILEYFYRIRENDINYTDEVNSVYWKNKEFISVYTDNKININTVSSIVLNSVIGSVEHQSESLIETLAAKIIEYRQANIFKNTEEQDFIANLTPEESALFNKIKGVFAVKSHYFMITSTGKSHNSQISISVVYDKQRKRLIYWRQE